jgi:hypothetical protein
VQRQTLVFRGLLGQAYGVMMRSFLQDAQQLGAEVLFGHKVIMPNADCRGRPMFG